ncbi:hypothetical protein KSI01_29260 [Kurthia sibirica]|nr:hypothetical protein KSI01_29260 [Kurthia sibirica]
MYMVVCTLEDTVVDILVVVALVVVLVVVVSVGLDLLANIPEMVES